MNFASKALLPHNGAACMGILRSTLGKKSVEEGKKIKGRAVFCEDALMDSQSALAELGVA